MARRANREAAINPKAKGEAMEVLGRDKPLSLLLAVVKEVLLQRIPSHHLLLQFPSLAQTTVTRLRPFNES
jgi:hypothetical protein